MDSIEKKLYGDYPYPFQTQEYKHGYGVAPRQGADNIALLMQGWHGLQQQAPQPPGARGPQGATAYRGPPPPQQHYGATTSAAYGAAYAQGPPPAAGAPTNYAYDVYGYGGPQPSTRSPRGAPPGAGQPPYGSEAPSPLPQHGPAAGSYTPQVPGEIPRAGRGLFAESGMHDHVRENFTGGPVSPADAGAAYGPGGAGGRAPGSLAAVARNQDALQAFMTGMAGGPTPKNKEVGFENFYGKAHAGKATVSHLTPEVNGLQGPTEPLDTMPHIKSNRAGHQSHLESNPDGGYIPRHGPHAKDTTTAFSGLRIFPGQPQTLDHLHASPTGLTASQQPSPTGPRMVHGTAKNTNISMSNMGLSHQGNESGYPAINRGPYANKASSTNLAYKEAGITQAGEAAARFNPYAGISSRSQLQAGEGGLGGSEGPKAWANPHAGKGQASQLTHSSGTMTIVPQVGGPQPRRPAVGVAGKDSWSTTYDSAYLQPLQPAPGPGPDIYTTVQHSNYFAAVSASDHKPTRF